MTHNRMITPTGHMITHYALFDVDKDKIVKKYKTLAWLDKALDKHYDNDSIQGYAVDNHGHRWTLDEAGKPEVEMSDVESYWSSALPRAGER